MISNVKALLLLLLVILGAGALAVFVRDWNERVVAPFPSAPTSTEPAIVVIYAPTSSAATIQIAKSVDGVTTVSMDTRQLVKGALPNPFTFVGTTTAFESSALWKLTESDGTQIGGGVIQVMSPDVGIPGPFQIQAFYDVVPTTATGTLTIYEASAKDGEPIHVVAIPVTLSSATTTVRAYFGNAAKGSDVDCGLAFGLTHTVVAGADPVAVAMHELLKGPTPFEQTRGYTSSLPEGVRQPVLTRQGNRLIADFDLSLELGVAGSCRVTAIRSQITQTLQQGSTQPTEISIQGRTQDILQP